MSRRTVLEGRWAALARAAGGVSALAAALGVAPNSIWRWGTGHASPSPIAAKLIAALAKKLGVRSPLVPA